jgi:hypothetical protein
MLEKNQYERKLINKLFENHLFTPINVQKDPLKDFLSGVNVLNCSGESKNLKKTSEFSTTSAYLSDHRGLWSFGITLAK